MFSDKKFKSVTRFLFVSTQLAALLWVTLSYLIAFYATAVLKQPEVVMELSKQVIITILGVNVLKVLENIFEHNNSKVFGHTVIEEPVESNIETDEQELTV